MRKFASVTWLRVERAPDMLVDLIPGLLLIVGGVLVMGLGLAVS